MKKFFLTFFVLFSISLFSANIDRIDMTSENLIIKFSKNIMNEDYFISADEDSRLIYIEILNLDKKSILKLTKDIENKIKKSNFFEDVNVTKGDENLSIVIQVLPKVSFFIDANSKKIDILFKKSNKNKHLIVIDPGHGGKDPGAVRGKTYEKDIVFSISKYLKDELSKDFNILMTRDKDIFIKLHERPKIGNRAKAKLFVSIHANASNSSKANGVETFYFSKKSSPYAQKVAMFENSFGEKYGENTDEIAQISGELSYKKNQEKSIYLANNVVDKIAKALKLRQGKSHGANFAVLRGFDGPGILIEVGFVSNNYDRKIITNKNSQKKIAMEIAKSIREYFK